jgi:photosystem II stability/assembly factor-like uncharacterized protein
MRIWRIAARALGAVGALVLGTAVGGVAGSGAGASLAGAAVLPPFAVASVTFVSAQEAFVLGTAACLPSPCTSIIHTLDGGQTWRPLPVPLPPIRRLGATRPGVWGIRFATSAHGFVFGTGLWETTDSGKRWHHLAWRRGSILSLAVIDQQVLALTARCSPSAGCGKTATLLRRPLAGGRWHAAAHLLTPSLADPANAIGIKAGVAALLDGTHVLVTRNGGKTVGRHATPCPTTKTAIPASVAVTSSHSLALLCAGQGHAGHTAKQVWRSSNLGRSWSRAGSPPTPGDGGTIAAASRADLTIATSSTASWLYHSADRGRHWSTARVQHDGGLGWVDLGFITSRAGAVVYEPADTDSNTDGRPGWLLLTNDGGAHWHRVRL